MKLVIASVIVLCFGVAQAATTAEPQSESCDQIRAQIKEHVGIPSKPNTSLLGKVGANKRCRFTSAEAYRAAWGDKPMPKDDRRGKARRHHDGGDD